MSFLREAKELIRSYGIRPKKRMGQNFIVDPLLIKKIADYAELDQSDVVLDVGAGLGFLTRELARRAGKVLAVEIDPKLVKVLEDQLSCYENVDIICGNFLEVQLPPFNKVASAPPYSISSPLMFKLLEYDLELGVLTFQEEFARRLVARSGTKDYGRLTVMTCYKADVRMLEAISKRAFYPQPETNSAIVLLKPRKAAFQAFDEKMFTDVVRWLFTQRNRVIVKALRSFLRRVKLELQAEALAIELPFATKRVFQLMPEEFATLSNVIYERLRGVSYSK